MPGNNVVEILLHAKDETNEAFKSLNEKFESLKHKAEAFVVALGIEKIAEVVSEAQFSVAKLDATFRANAGAVQLSRKQIDEMTESLEKMTGVDNDVIRSAESILLTFNKVRGDAFERTLKAAADLSVVMGGDLVDATRAVGVALESPEEGLLRLRRAGVLFSDSQKALIKQFVETGQNAKAQDVILSEIEKRFGGAAEAARNTLGGALRDLKNAFLELFKQGRDSTSGAVEGIGALSEALRDPQIKKGIDSILSGLGAIAAAALKAGAALAKGLAGNSGKVTIEGLVESINNLDQQAEHLRNAKVGRGGIAVDTSTVPEFSGRGHIPGNAAAFEQQAAELRGKLVELLRKQADETEHATVVTDKYHEALDTVNITLKKTISAHDDLIASWNAQTFTPIEKEADELRDGFLTINALLSEGAINKDTAKARRSALLDKILPDFNVEELKLKLRPIEQLFTTFQDNVANIFENIGLDFKATLSDMFYNWKFTFKGFVDIARRAVSDILTEIITSGIKKAILGQLGASGSGGILKAALKFFGFAAGGASIIDKPTWVGEEGKELAIPSGGGARIYNQRELASMLGGGGSSVYAPTFAATIVSKDADRDKQEMFAFMERRFAQERLYWTKILGKNGVRIK